MTPIESPHLSEDAIVDLVAGLVDDTPRASLQEHLRRCVPCERRLREAWRDAERARMRGRPLEKDRLGSGVAPARRRIAVGVAAAAVVAVLLGAPMLLRRGQAPARLDAWVPVDGEQNMLRSADPSADAVYGEALAAYARRDARRVVDLLAGREIPASREPMKLLLASALVMDGRAADARALIEGMDVPTLPQPARDRALWTLAAALLREERAAEAKDVLRRLADDPGGEFALRARAALEDPGLTGSVSATGDR